MYVGCDATISNAKFNFTGDEFTSSACVAFQNGTNGSTIKNCEFIIDKCGTEGFYCTQAGLKIENSKFDINVYSQDSGSTPCGFQLTKSFSIDGGTYDLGKLIKASSANMSIKNATVTANCPSELKLTENSVIDNSTMNLELSDYGRVTNYSNNITNTKFNFSGKSVNYPFYSYSEKLTNCNFNFLNFIFNSDDATNSRSGVYLSSSCTITNCSFNGATNSIPFVDGSIYSRGGAIYIEFSDENQSVVFENCIFSNNKVVNGADVGSVETETGGGAIAIAFFANNNSVKLKDCSFINNYSNTGLACHLWAASKWTSMEEDPTGCSILFSGTNTMTGPSLSEFIPGKTLYKDEAIYVNGPTLGYY